MNMIDEESKMIIDEQLTLANKLAEIIGQESIQKLSWDERGYIQGAFAITVYEIAFALYKEGYRKLNDNQIIVSKDGAAKTNAEVRKNLAKEILSTIASPIYSIGDDIYELTLHDIQELATEYGVEAEKVLMQSSDMKELFIWRNGNNE